MVTAGATATVVARSLWRLCTSHDFSFRPSDAQEMQREFSLLRAQSPGLFWTYFFSSFTYSLIGASMLLLFELPTVFRDSAPLPYEAYAALLLVQGLLSFAADVWARALRGFPRHAWYRVPRRPRLQPRALPHQTLPTQPTPRHAAPHHAPPSQLPPRRYLADRVLASLMTVYTFALGLVFWGAHSSPTQRAIAAASLGGLVPILLSQHSLRRAQPVDHRHGRQRRRGCAAPRPPALLQTPSLWAALDCSGLPCRAALPSPA